MGLYSGAAAWFEKKPVIAIGGVMSAVFLFVGLVGTVAFFPEARDWLASASWPRTEAEIVSSREAYSMRGRTKRPDFTYRYEWQGQGHTASGYAVLNVYTTSSFNDETREVLRAHPVGSRVQVLVNPERPSQVALIRGTVPGLFVFAVPPFFAVLGVIGATFTLAGSRGWLDESSTSPYGRVVRRFGGWALQEKVLKTVFFTIVGAVILGFVLGGIASGNMLLVLVGGFVGWGLWRAARKRRE